jgi:hypothetical protein
MRKYKKILFLLAVLSLQMGIGSIWAASNDAQEQKSRYQRNLELWAKMPLQEKQRILKNYERWKALSTEKQKVIEQRFRVFQQYPRERQVELKDQVRREREEHRLPGQNISTLDHSANTKSQPESWKHEQESTAKKIKQTDSGSIRLKEHPIAEKKEIHEHLNPPEHELHLDRPTRDQKPDIDSLHHADNLEKRHDHPPPIGVHLEHESKVLHGH